jgi:hypothetical protein
MDARMPRASGLVALALPLFAALASCGPKAVETPIANIPAPLPQNIPLIETPPPPPPVLIGQHKGEDIWHLRSGLNVAVLLCHGPDNQAMVNSYNMMLRQHKLLLTEAAQNEVDIYKARGGKKWQDAYDDHMTKVYNAYSGTLTRESYCSLSKKLLSEAEVATPLAFREQATVMLWELNKSAGLPDPDGKLARAAAASAMLPGTVTTAAATTTGVAKPR